MTCEICGGEFTDVNGYCPFCGTPMKSVAKQTESELQVMHQVQPVQPQPEQQQQQIQNNYQQPVQYYSSFPQQEVPGQMYTYQQTTHGQYYYQQQGYGTVGQNSSSMLFESSGSISDNFVGGEAQKIGGKSKKALIIGIITSVAVMAGVFVFFLVLGVFSSKNGSYHFKDAKEGEEILLVVNGEEGTLTVSANGETKYNTVRINFEDDNMTIRSAEGKVSAFYNTKKHAIILEKRTLYEQGFFPVTNDGKYLFMKAEISGMTLDVDSMKSFGVDVSDFYIKINGSEANINLMGEGGDCEVIIEGSTIKFIQSGKELLGTYNSDAKTITVEVSEGTMVFKKTEEFSEMSGSYTLEKE